MIYYNEFYITLYFFQINNYFNIYVPTLFKKLNIK